MEGRPWICTWRGLFVLFQDQGAHQHGLAWPMRTDRTSSWRAVEAITTRLSVDAALDGCLRARATRRRTIGQG